MSEIVFAAIVPHPPILLPNVGSEKDREKVKKTINSLEKLGAKLKKMNPEKIIIFSPHQDWGFNVPLYFLAKDFQGKIEKHLEKGEVKIDQRTALIASGDLSHCLKKEGPYGFHPEGPLFDQELMESLKEKDLENILKLDEKYPNAGQCGLRSINSVLQILNNNYRPKILSYEAPFGVGYLVVDLL